MGSGARYHCGMDRVEYLLLAGAAIGALMRLLKSKALDVKLASVGLPPIPKNRIPWIAAALGVATGTIDGMLRGASWGVALRMAVFGLLAGAFATWGHEAGIESGRGGRELGGPPKSPPDDVVDEGDTGPDAPDGEPPPVVAPTE